MTGSTVLIVSDQLRERGEWCKLLEPLFQVVTASSRAEALLVARTHAPKVILVDIGLAANRELVFCPQLRLEPSFKNTDIIAIGTEIEKTLCEGLLYGAAFLKKPVSETDLLSGIASCQVWKQFGSVPNNNLFSVIENSRLAID